MRLEANKWYIAECGYLVFIEKVDPDVCYASVDTSPGENIDGHTAPQAFKGKRGWGYSFDGSTNSLKDNKGMTIVAEYPNEVKLPNGYMWKDGYPKLYQYAELDKEDYFISFDATRYHKVTEFVAFGNKISIGEKRIGLVKVETPVVSPSKSVGAKLTLEVGKWYITKGDYLVHIKGRNDHSIHSDFISSPETSPGLAANGLSYQEIHHLPSLLNTKGWGWTYTSDGRPHLLNSEWSDKLTIVAEYPYPVNLPEGFAWKDGYPKLYEFSELPANDYFISPVGHVYGATEVAISSDTDIIGTKRISVVKMGTPQFIADDNIVGSERIGLVPIKESEEMKKETAIAAAKIAGNLGFRALNYWFFEPAVNTFRPIVKGVRYAVFISTLVSVIYGAKHPDVVKNAIMSCLPKVSIEAPEILK